MKTRPKDWVPSECRERVAEAVKSGLLPPVSSEWCLGCGSPAQERHHVSYRREMALVYTALCQDCHVILHRSRTTGRPNELPATLAFVACPSDEHPELALRDRPRPAKRRRHAVVRRRAGVETRLD